MAKTKEELINSYSDKDLAHVEPLMHVFLKPSMYLGSVDTPQHTLEEAVMNSIDEVRIGVAEKITVTLHSDGSISVLDDGRGVPAEFSEKFGEPTLRAAFTKINTGKALAGDGDGSSQHGVGMKAVVATSEWFEVKSFRDGKVYYDRYEFKNGEPAIPTVKLKGGKNLPAIKQEKTDLDHGTMVRWLPSDKVFDSNKFNKKVLRNFLKSVCYVVPEVTIELIDETSGSTMVFSEPNGIKQLVEDLIKKEGGDLITPVYSFEDSAVAKVGGSEVTISAEVSFAWSDNSSRIAALFTNNVPNPLLGTPIVGAGSGFSKLLNRYATELGLSKTTIKSRDLIPGLVLVVSLKHPKPKFNGQSKKEVTSEEASSAMNQIVYHGGQIVLDRDVEGIIPVIKQALKRASDRKKEDESNFNLKDKGNKLATNKKLSNCKLVGAGKGSELFLVEGDSAGGSVRNEKDPMFQAMIPFRGKVLNAYKSSVSKALGNSEIGAFFTAVGAGILDSVDISKRNYDRIIIATDQDPDGAAISNLIISAILRFCPELIKGGFVYRVLTPLFVNELKDGSRVYTYSNFEQKEFLAKKRKQVKKVQRNKGLGELDAHEVKETIIDPRTRRLIQITLPEDSDLEEETFELIDKLMGKETEERKKLFFDPNLYRKN